MCLMEGLIIQAILAEFESERTPRSAWERHAERIALSRAAQGHRAWAETLAQVAERLLARFLRELGCVFRRGLFSGGHRQ